ncbi:hypothetical protein BJ508DRAFT_314635 [Ascobolus immersus RN42]|uniref:Uncharacterized protein n=1 Tax=Ascobolus immersus RN42 TaxID=1160509 RepID=A0A3N4HEB1_ASCIM|nr:hypothetical protein BJ508DRAFT_314635 [Ascobolus immersus RN42]
MAQLASDSQSPNSPPINNASAASIASILQLEQGLLINEPYNQRTWFVSSICILRPLRRQQHSPHSTYGPGLPLSHPTYSRSTPDADVGLMDPKNHLRRWRDRPGRILPSISRAQRPADESIQDPWLDCARIFDCPNHMQQHRKESGRVEADNGGAESSSVV